MTVHSDHSDSNKAGHDNQNKANHKGANAQTDILFNLLMNDHF